ncbi:flagellar protein FlhE [Pseudomonas sp. NA-150]|uniref:flagellar protein FlhE n=1 Tax=Pseudomonas sp. NA-150 TaxID=3367525 RepID=UPI0037CCBC11
MCNKIMFSKSRCALLGVVSALVMYSQASMAWAYSSSVGLPTVHHKGYTYQAHLPVTGVVPAGAAISRVSWNWNVVGFPRGLLVSICQGSVNNCHPISRQRSGSTNRFDGGNPSQPFFFQVHMINNRESSPVPVGGLSSGVTVTW